MKRFIAGLCAGVFALAIIGCGNPTPPPAPKDGNNNQAAPAGKETPAPAGDATNK